MDRAYAPTLAPFLDSLVDDIRSVLGDELVAVYLYGSAVSGGFDAGVSDVDLVAVTSREVEDLNLAGLDRVHRDVVTRSPEWTDRVEVVYIGTRTLASFRTSSGQLAVISPGETFHLTGPVSDWLQNWYLVREEGIPLVGPPAADVVPPISRAEFQAAIGRYLDYLRAQPNDELRPGPLSYAVLSACRALRTVRTGLHCSKQEGAAWVRDRRPESAWLIDAALACRLSRGSVGFDDEQTRSAAADIIRSLADEVRS